MLCHVSSSSPWTIYVVQSHRTVGQTRQAAGSVRKHCLTAYFLARGNGQKVFWGWAVVHALGLASVIVHLIYGN